MDILRLATLQGRSAFWDKQVLHQYTLLLQELHLFVDTASIACERAVGAYHPMAGDDERDTIMSHRQPLVPTYHLQLDD